MFTITKYPLALSYSDSGLSIDMPLGAIVLALGIEKDTVYLYVRTEVGAPISKRVFYIYQTGAEFESLDWYVGSVIFPGHRECSHVFELHR
jgi:hypothetical protein